MKRGDSTYDSNRFYSKKPFGAFRVRFAAARFVQRNLAAARAAMADAPDAPEGAKKAAPEFWCR